MNSFELSPGESPGVLELAKSCLFGGAPKSVGKMKYLCTSLKAKHGKPLNEQEMVEVELTVNRGVEDLDILRAQRHMHQAKKVLRSSLL